MHRGNEFRFAAGESTQRHQFRRNRTAMHHADGLRIELFPVVSQPAPLQASAQLLQRCLELPQPLLQRDLGIVRGGRRCV